MELLILLGLIVALRGRRDGLQPVAEIMPQILPEAMLPSEVMPQEQKPIILPTGTIRGPGGEGIRFQEEGEIVAALSTSNPGRNPRSKGSMQLRMRIANFSDDWFRFRYQNLGKAFTDHFELAVVSPFMMQGNTPDWFKAAIAEVISKVDSDVSKVWRIIDGKIPNPTPRELSVDAIDSGSIPIIRHIKSRKTNTSPGMATQLLLPDIRQDKVFNWDFRNNLGEKVASGIYMAMGFLRGIDQTFSTGWMKFVVQ